MDLQDIRKELDRIDNSIIELIAERMSYIPKVAEYKIKNNLERVQTKREEEQVINKRALCDKHGINPDLGEEFIKMLIKYAHMIEKDIMGK